MASPKTLDDAEAFLAQIRNSFGHGSEAYEDFLQLILDFGSRRISVETVMARVGQLFQGNRSLASGLNGFLPKQYEIVSAGDEKAVNFVKRVKLTLGDDPQAYKSFCSNLDMYSRGEKSIIDVYKETRALFRKHPDLFREFGYFLPDTNVEKKRKIEYTCPDAKRVCCVREEGTTLHDSGVHRQLRKCIGLYRSEIITRSELQNLVDDLVGDDDRELRQWLGEELGVTLVRNGKDDPPRKFKRKSIQEIDLTKCEQITPSYRLLPEKSITTKGDSILNDICVCVAPPSSSKHRHKTALEVELFKCEDEMFEMDMVMGPINDLLLKARELFQRINDDKTVRSILCLEDHLTEQNLRCIKRLYNNKKVLDRLLHDRASVALPILIRKLEQKEKDWEECRANNKRAFDKLYAEDKVRTRARA